jgi:selenide,water dikinase
VLVFTKRIGTGVVTTALKREIANEAHVQAAVDSMLTLNRAAAEALAGFTVHACTDITGFGLIGHSREMAREAA